MEKNSLVNDLWSSDARLSSQVWYGMNVATRFILLKRWGIEPTVDHQFKTVRAQQLAHFLEGVSKLGLSDEPHPQLCAKYHAISNLLGGYDVGYRDDGDRAWIYYFPPNSYAGGPMLPTPAMPASPQEVLEADFRAWHANNGVLLANDRLQFVLTDLLLLGGPFDAGYWHCADRPLAEHERFVKALGRERRAPGELPQFNIADWPIERRDSALRKYTAQYALGGIVEIAKARGMEEAADIAQQSHQTTMLAWCRTLVDRWELASMPPTKRLAALFERCWRLLGDDLQQTTDGRDVLLTHRTKVKVFSTLGYEAIPRPIEVAIATAWTTLSLCLGDRVEVTTEPAQSGGASHSHWRFHQR
ncbi:MAG: hypothetical protein ABW034_10845 [Steroidobacteraceae bacterium]